MSCRKMEAESFANSVIIRFMNDHFVTARVDVDKEKKIASTYFVRGLPTSWFLESDGSKITNIPGYADQEIFLIFLKYIDSESYKKMSFRDFMKSRPL